VTFFLLCAAGCLTGCGNGGATQRYVPETATARGAVEAALTAWKNGEPHQTIKTFETPIDVFDARWRGGKKLESFEIVGEGPADPHPTYRVKLRFTGTGKDEEDTFLVVGIDPILVFRSEDYHRDAGM
jgi:hypothetical protein